MEPRRVLLVGGAAANRAVGAVAATLFDVPVIVPPAGEYVADGAARQAAWALSGATDAPTWEQARDGASITIDPAPVREVREAYAGARTSLYG